MRCSTSRHTGCQWAFPTRGVRPLDQQCGPNFRRWSKNGTWSRVLTALHASSRTALGRKAPRPSDGRYRHAPRSRGFERRCDLFTTTGGPYGRTNAPNGSSASTSTGLATLRASRPRCDLRGQCRRTDTRRPRPLGRATRLELVLVDRGHCAVAAQRLSNKFNYEVRRVGCGEPPRNEHGAKVFRPIRHAWRVEWPTAISCVGDVWRAASKTP